MVQITHIDPSNQEDTNSKKARQQLVCDPKEQMMGLLMQSASGTMVESSGRLLIPFNCPANYRTQCILPVLPDPLTDSISLCDSRCLSLSYTFL